MYEFGGFHRGGRIPKHILNWAKEHGQTFSLREGTRKRITDGSLKAGEIILFSYRLVLKDLRRKSPNHPFIRTRDKSSSSLGGEYRIGFVVNTGGGRTNGVFASNIGTQLLSVFKLSSSTFVNKIVLKAFYRKRNVSYRSFINVLGAIYGHGSFRTYRLDFVRDLQILKFDLRKLRPQVEEDD